MVATLASVILRPNKGKLVSNKADPNQPIIRTLVWFMMDHHLELLEVNNVLLCPLHDVLVKVGQEMF